MAQNGSTTRQMTAKMPKITKGRLLIRLRRGRSEARWRRDTNGSTAAISEAAGPREGGFGVPRGLRYTLKEARARAIAPLELDRMMAARDEIAIREPLPKPTRAEHAVADLLPIGADEETAQAALEDVPFWFHTFSLNDGAIYTPGVARVHRYRIPVLPDDLSGMSVLDVGTFDGFYGFLA